MALKGLIFDIKRYSINDGPGIRTTIFFKGCPLSCWWCHNPESQSMKPEKYTQIRKLDDIEFRRDETIGSYYTVHELITEIEKETIFHDESFGGVTFSGGEPLMQHEFLIKLAKECKHRNIHTCLDTCGYVNPDIFNITLDYIDLFLYDIKLIDSNLHQKYTNVKNDVILQNLKKLMEMEKQVIIRFPVIPGFNNSDNSIYEMKTFLNTLKNKRKEIHLLPYHTIGNNKYIRFKVHNKMKDLKDMKKDELLQIKQHFEEIGYKVKIGG